ncbi:hypothetical protein IGB42_04313 [Andreprevotia sp. IGB-42]|nr:hypothetical protein IGB42_04313 [Andreprevotia sp. IGB-42]
MKQAEAMTSSRTGSSAGTVSDVLTGRERLHRQREKAIRILEEQRVQESLAKRLAEREQQKNS